MPDDLSSAAERGKSKQGPRNLSEELSEEEENEAEETTRFTADLPKDLHHRFRVRAAQEDRSMKAIMVEALENYLSG